MEKQDIKTQVVLHHDFGASNTVARNDNRMPEPLAKLTLSADHPRNCATYTLLEGSLRYYPLDLEDFMKSDVLRAQFKCRAKDAVISTRYDRPELDKQEGLLRPYADESVAAWNLVQIRTAMKLMDNAPEQGRAVSYTVIDSFRKAPHSFYDALMAPRPRSLQ